MTPRTKTLLLICLFSLQISSTLLNTNTLYSTIRNEAKLPILKSPITSSNFSNSAISLTTPSFKLQSFQTPSILFLVGDENSLNNIYDINFYNFMFSTLGFNVIYHTANDSYDYTNYDAIVISRSVPEEGTVETLANASIPILTMEPGHGDEFPLGNGLYDHKWKEFITIPTGSDIASDINHYIVSEETPGSSKQIYNGAWEDTAFLKGYTVSAFPSECEAVRLAYYDLKYATIVALDKNHLDWNLQPSPERRVFWGIPETDLFLSSTWDWWKKSLYWTLYDDFPGNATVNVNVKDLDGYNIADAQVNLTDSLDSSNSWILNTSSSGRCSFPKIPWGQYNIEVKYKSVTNNTLTNLEIAPARTYIDSMTFDYSVVVENYLDEDPPIISNIYFNKTTSTFFADVTDFSNLSYVYLNLTAHNLTTGAVEIILQNFTMIPSSGITYYNATTLDSLTGTLVNITYNIIAEDNIGYSSASPIRYFDLDDPDAPIVWNYDAIDFGNGSTTFYTNVTDASGIQPPVILQVNSDYFAMDKSDSGLWVYTGLFDYGVEIGYTIFSVFDQVGNENGSNIYPILFPLKSITPIDTTPPRISSLSDTFSIHEQGYVEFDVNIDDWNQYQSGVNATSVEIVLEINGINISSNITQIGEITFSYEFTFNYNDSIYYWIKALDLEDNMIYSSKRGPFHINDNAIPDIFFWANEYGNGTLDFYTRVTDWPNNDTSTFILFTGDYFAVEWMNFSMTPINDTFFMYRYPNFPYQEQDVWYYGTAFDSANNTLQTPLDSAKSLNLSDSMPPEITLTLVNSTTNDGQVDLFARAIDPYGSQIFVNSSFYLNISSSMGTITREMTYDPSFYPFSTYNFSFSYPYQEEITIMVWVSDIAGNQGQTSKTIVIQDFTPPDITEYGVLEFQNGTIIIWADVMEGFNGSGLLVDNSSVILNWAYIHELTANMEWNGTGNYFCYKIVNREPRDAITYNITVFDNAGNIASTGLQLYKIIDTTAPIFVVYPSLNETQRDHITSEVTFWTIAQDTFGEISHVVLEYDVQGGAGWSNFSTMMKWENEIYSFKVNLLPNTTLRYRMIVIDEWSNNVTSTYTYIELSDFTPATFDLNSYGTDYLQSDPGTVKIWASVNDSFFDECTNVTIAITDLTTSTSVVSDSLMIREGDNHSFVFEVEFLHEYSISLTLVDLGVFYGYYQAANLMYENIYIDDQWQPEFHGVGYTSLNSTEFLFWANITDWGSGVDNVTLYYTFEAGKGGQINQEAENVLMQYNGSHFVTTISIKVSGTLFWEINAFDNRSSSTFNGPETGSTFIIGKNQLGIPYETLALASLGLIIILAFVGSLTISVRKRRQKVRTYKETLQEKLSFLTNTYTILVSSSAGVPILTTTNVIYQGDDSMNGALSGLSVGIDSFLESFQSDFMNQVYSNQDYRSPQQAGDVKVSLIEQNEVQILILGSETYRVFVFLREIPSEFLRTTFIKIIQDLEQNLKLDDLGIVDEAIMSPQVLRIIRHYLPIDLLKPFKIDLQKVRYFDQLLTKGEDKSPISRVALNALKILIVTTFSRHSTTKKVKSLLKLCDEYITQTSQRFTGVTIYTNAKAMISKFTRIPIELEYELFWEGIDEKVKILVPEDER